MKVAIAPHMYEWAINRSQRGMDVLCEKFPKLPQWIAQERQPTFKQLERFAKSVYLPAGYFFSDTPPDEPLPISDFRTMGNRHITPPSPNLLDTIYDCQNKQEWYKEHCLQNGEDKNSFVGSLTTDTAPRQAAEKIHALFFTEPQQYSTAADAFAKRAAALENRGILIMTNGIAKGNTRRPLNLEEFRGFALSSEYAPIIFINARDTAAARSFTLMHELAHIALGVSGVSNAPYDHEIEKWCSEVANEVLMPRHSIMKNCGGNIELTDTAARLANMYKVSTLAVMLRLNSMQLLNMAKDEFWQLYSEEKARLKKIKTGDGYCSKILPAISPQFFIALAVSTLEGKTLYRDALRLANIRKVQTFERLAKRKIYGLRYMPATASGG